MELKKLIYKNVLAFSKNWTQEPGVQEGLIFDEHTVGNIEGVPMFFTYDYYIGLKTNCIKGMYVPSEGESTFLSTLNGCITLAIVDIRKDSSVYGKYHSVKLRRTGYSFFIPHGYAFGVAGLSNASFLLKSTARLGSGLKEIKDAWTSPRKTWEPANASTISDARDFLNLSCL
jgi:dTDP-4-dehydrorhamnose 3,5-epimerase-like enzyme